MAVYISLYDKIDGQFVSENPTFMHSVVDNCIDDIIWDG